MHVPSNLLPPLHIVEIAFASASHFAGAPHASAFIDCQVAVGVVVSWQFMQLDACPILIHYHQGKLLLVWSVAAVCIDVRHIISDA